MSEQAPKYWRTLEELAESSAARGAAEHEFLPETVNDSLSAATVSRSSTARQQVASASSTPSSSPTAGAARMSIPG